MAKFLITMLPANDLGLPTRMVPIARALADRGHEVAVFNPAPAPSRLIAEAGLTNLPMPARPMPVPAFDLTMVAEGWDVEHFFAGLYTSEEYVRDAAAVYVDLIRDYGPDMVVDSFSRLRASLRASPRCRWLPCCKAIFIRRVAALDGGKTSGLPGCRAPRPTSVRLRRSMDCRR